MARVLVVDDHPVVRSLLRAICADLGGFEVVGESETAARALRDFERLRPSVVVLDLVLPDGDGLEVARRLRATASPPRILVLSAREDPEALLGAISAGVHGYLSKTSTSSEIRDALAAVGRGERVITATQESTAARALGGRARLAAEASKVMEALTPRQREILKLVGEGVDAKTMAARLGISERSVRSHLTALYRRLGVRNRVEAVNRALIIGLIGTRGEASHRGG